MPKFNAKFILTLDDKIITERTAVIEIPDKEIWEAEAVGPETRDMTIDSYVESWAFKSFSYYTEWEEIA